MKKFLKNESGATAIEYALIACIMGSMLLSIMPVFSDQVKTQYVKLASTIEPAI